MKIFNKFAAALMALPLMAGLTACHDDHAEYTPADRLANAQVYFPTTLPTEVILTNEGTSFDVELDRVNVKDELTVLLVTTQNEESTAKVNVPASVTFPAGESKVVFPVTYNGENAKFDDFNNVVITIADSTYTTPYGESFYAFSAGVPAPWENIGNAIYREDMVSHWFGVENLEYEVPIQKNSLVEGLYRLVNPYGKYYPYNAEADYDASAMSYWVIHAEDPEYVWLEPHISTMDWGYGAFGFSSIVGMWIANGNTLEDVKAARPDAFGKLEDGVITFPTAQTLIISMADYQGGGWYYANDNGLFAIALPGASLINYDYTAEAVYAGLLKTPAETYQGVVDLTLGADVANAKYAMTSADVSEEEAAAAIVAGELEAEEITESSRVYLPVEEEGKYRVTVVTFDAEGEAQESASCVFEFEKGGSSWESLGECLYTDDFMTMGWYDEESGEWKGVYDGLTPQTYAVEVLASTKTPGLYRVKNAYGEAYPFNEEGDWDASMDYFLEIDATDPENVFIEKQALGLDWGYGMISVESDAAYYMNKWQCSPAEVIATFAQYDLSSPFGTLADDAITFPEDVFTVSFGENELYGNHNGAFKVNLKPASESAVKAAKFARRLRGGKTTSFAAQYTNGKRMFVKKLIVVKNDKPAVLK